MTVRSDAAAPTAHLLVSGKAAESRRRRNRHTPTRGAAKLVQRSSVPELNRRSDRAGDERSTARVELGATTPDRQDGDRRRMMPMAPAGDVQLDPVAVGATTRGLRSVARWRIAMTVRAGNALLDPAEAGESMPAQEGADRRRMQVMARAGDALLDPVAVGATMRDHRIADRTGHARTVPAGMSARDEAIVVGCATAADVS